MNKIILAAACGLFAASLNAAENLYFTDAAFTKQLTASPTAAKVEIPAATKQAKTKAGRYFQVSGYVNLSGNGFLYGANPSYTSITLNGWANFSDSSGQVTSNNSYINVPAYMWITPNQYVMQTVWPNVYTQFYYKGSPVGMTSMSGSVMVSGFPSGNFVSLHGSGYLNGSVYVADAE